MDNKDEIKDTKEEIKEEKTKNIKETTKKDEIKKEEENPKKDEIKKEDNSKNLAKDRKEMIEDKDKTNKSKEAEVKAKIKEKDKIEANTKDETNWDTGTETTDLIKSEDIEIDEKKLKRINEEIKENKKKSRNNEAKNEKYVRIFRNVVIAAIGIAYISIALVGSKRIPEEQYVLDLKVFIILGVVCAILLFEKSFKTDMFRFALVGIEVLVLAGATVMLLHLYKLQNQNILKYSKYFILLWSAYYIVKSIIIAVKRPELEKKEAENN